MPLTLMTGAGAWGMALLGVWLTFYVMKQWRRAAKACHPMPFRRRKGYVAGMCFSLAVIAAPVAYTQQGCLMLDAECPASHLI